MGNRIKIIAIEEHDVPHLVLDAWAAAGVPEIPELGFGDDAIARRLRNHGEQRLSEMDDQGVDVAVLSLPTRHRVSATWAT